jgi:AcrR family transcriptional regulator
MAEILRRPSYGPSSPVVGARGARTRRAIVDAALAQFEDRGFHATSIDDIATAVGISRAALYQYFESKEQLFIELLRESGAHLVRVVRRLGPLGPTAVAFDNLHWWMGEWAWVQDKYSTMFVQWANVDSPKAPLRPLISNFLDACASRISERIAGTPTEGLDPEDAAVALLAIMIRINYYRHTGATRGLSDDAILDTLARVIQRALYPSTPAAALELPATAASVADRAQPHVTASPRGVVVPLSARRHGTLRWENRFGGRSDRAVATANRLLDAGAAAFAAHGFNGSSVDEILNLAGVGRGTFYKYFNDKLDLLVMLAENCGESLKEMFEQFAEIDARAYSVGLRSWLRDFVAFHRAYSGVFRVWTEREPKDAVLAEIGRDVAATTLVTFDQVLGRVPRPYPFDVRAGSLVLLALLERVPDYAVGTKYEMSTDEQVEVLALFIERGLVSGRRGTRPRRDRSGGR